MNKLTSKVKARIDEYLEFDSNLILEKPVDYGVIFGGAIRDSIADQPINDIDILCLRNSHDYIEKILSEQGYTFFSSLSIKQIHEMYKEIHCIFEPRTWMKNNKIIQLIRPASVNGSYSDRIGVLQKRDIMILNFKKLLSNVDLSCCGVYYDGKELKESITDAIIHCRGKVFKVNESAIMYNENRIIDRKYKLENRGWKDINLLSESDKKKLHLYNIKDVIEEIKK